MQNDKPILLDLFCGAGGAAVGYNRAGFDIVGVDINKQPNYPFEFIQADWEEPLYFLPGLWEREKRPYVIHASPPCQAYSLLTNMWDKTIHSDLIPNVRERLKLINAPYVIENVIGAPLLSPIKLCGTSFGLGVRRHRLFELSDPPILFPPCNHYRHKAMRVTGNTGGSSKRDTEALFGTLEDWKISMGIDWTITAFECKEAIPPAYTEWIGKYLIEYLRSKNAE